MENENEEFKCPRCGYTSQDKSNYIRHLSRKFPCLVKFEDIPIFSILESLPKKQYNKLLKCDFCELCFTAKTNRCRHMKVCEKNYNEKKDVEKYKELFDKITDLQDQINNNKLKHPVNNTTYNTNIVINTPKLRNFGDENMDALPESLVRELFIDLKYADLIENLHCDPDYPENHNIRIKSIKRNTLEIYRNDKWVIITYESGLNEIITQSSLIFRNFYKRKRNEILEDMSHMELEEVVYRLSGIESMNQKDIKFLQVEIHNMLETFRNNQQLQTLQA